ncbi:UNVERIFIED_CONTAM: hypothetical protein HDU68_006640 [Siphonaria sp. JEL0065]|nr:hypothetical protein HDU68_006640 [Siphonaria sp. JEL0065]
MQSEASSRSPSIRTFQTQSTAQVPEYSTLSASSTLKVATEQRDLFSVFNQIPATAPPSPAARAYLNAKEIKFQITPGTLAMNPMGETMSLQEFQDRVNGLLLKELQPPENPYVWSTADVAAWVLANGGSSTNREAHCLTIREEGVTGKVLMITRIADLCQLLGVNRYGEKVLLEEGLKVLKRKGAAYLPDGEEVERNGTILSKPEVHTGGEEPPLYLG